jgi:dimethylamine monooxygenase subunit A
MALRDRFLAERRDEVLALLPEAREAAGEVLDLTLATLARRRTSRDGRGGARPDGVVVPVDRDDPLRHRRAADPGGRLPPAEAGRGACADGGGAGLSLGLDAGAEDRAAAHAASTGRSDAYDAEIGRRVQRLFDGLRPGRPLMRANLLWHGRARCTRRGERASRGRRARGTGYLRSERQCLVRLPRTGR